MHSQTRGYKLKNRPLELLTLGLRLYIMRPVHHSPSKKARACNKLRAFIKERSTQAAPPLAVLFTTKD